MADHPNVGTFRWIYTAFTVGDMDGLASFFAEDVRWHTPGRHALAGTYEGRAAAFASFAEEFELSGWNTVEIYQVATLEEALTKVNELPPIF